MPSRRPDHCSIDTTLIAHPYELVGDEIVEVRKIGLSQLFGVHDYQDSVACIDLDMRGQKLMSREVDILSSLTMKQQVRSVGLKSGPIDAEDLSMILQAVLWKSDIRCLSLHNCRVNSDVIQSALDNSRYTKNDVVVEGSKTVKEQKSSMKPKNNEEDTRLINDKLILLDLSFNFLLLGHKFHFKFPSPNLCIPIRPVSNCFFFKDFLLFRLVLIFNFVGIL